MKILLAPNGFPPHRWAGTETYTAGIAKGFKKLGHDVRVFCVGDWAVGKHNLNGFVDSLYHSIPVRRLNMNWKKTHNPFGYLYNNPLIAHNFAGYVMEFKPDLIHVTSCETLSASVLKVAKDARVPLVLTLTDFWFLCPRMNLLKSNGSNCSGITTARQCLRCQLAKGKIYRGLKRLFSEELCLYLLNMISRFSILTRQRGLRGFAGDFNKRKRFLKQALTLPDKLITASEFVKGIYNQNGVESHIDVISYGHDLSWLETDYKKTKSIRLRIGFVGQIVRSKGPHLLIKAISNLHDEYQNEIELLIYGDIKHSPVIAPGYWIFQNPFIISNLKVLITILKAQKYFPRWMFWLFLHSGLIFH